MASSTNKKVLIARFDRTPLYGFVNAGFLAGNDGPQSDSVELLSPEGTLIQVPLSETKAICFVRDFESIPSWTKHRTFASRPKTPGLWIRLRFSDGDTLEGLVPNNLQAIESIGYSVIPPDPTFQNQRIFVPRKALEWVEVLGVIGSSARKRTKPVDAESQLEMFE